MIRVSYVFPTVQSVKPDAYLFYEDLHQQELCGIVEIFPTASAVFAILGDAVRKIRKRCVDCLNLLLYAWLMGRTSRFLQFWMGYFGFCVVVLAFGVARLFFELRRLSLWLLNLPVVQYERKMTRK